MPLRPYVLALWIIFFESVGFLLGLLTSNNIPLWYAGLHKSALTPPAITFSIVWPILYAFIAFVGYQLWRNKEKDIFHYYAVNVVFNWLWTPLFFSLHWIGFSFIWILILTLLTLVITIKLRKNYNYLSNLFFIYFLWLVFASYLNGVIYLSN